MQQEFSKADLFVFPTLTEGMASVMVESVTAGCPVLTTKGAGFDGLEESGSGRIFEPGDAPSLANLLVNLTRDRATIQVMNEACVRFAKNFNEEAWANRLISILEKLTDGSFFSPDKRDMWYCYGR
jgi:glycosyltransferase involved in cell wall biosynthesis